MKKLGHLLFAVGMAGLGVLGLVFGDFAMVWQPVPPGVPMRETLAYASGALLLAGGVGLLLKRSAAVSALVLTLFVLSWLLLLQVPRVAANPGNEGMWLGFCENMLLVAGGWAIVASLSRRGTRPVLGFAAGAGPLRVARFLYAASLPVIGLSHFVYTEGTASMVPAWLPHHTGFAYLTGAGHIAAGVGLLLSVAPRLAAALEAAMISCFVLLLHAPGVAASPSSRLQWTMLFVALALNGSCWALAGAVSDAVREKGSAAAGRRPSG